MLIERISNTRPGGLVSSARRADPATLRVTTGLVVAGLLLGSTTGAAAAAPAGAAGFPMAKPVTAQAAPDAGAKYRKNLFLQYKTRKVCAVYLNFPKRGVKGNARPAWSLPAGKNIVWRYNASRTWAVVTLPARKKQGQYPWWGFTQRDCIGESIKQTLTWKKKDNKWVTVKFYPAGRPVSDRIRQGLSGKGDKFKMKWRRVHFNEASAPVVRHRVKICRNATLRDRANFVVGNVPQGWRVHVTGQHRTGQHWVKVYVPNAKRWGYVEEAAITCSAAAAASAVVAPAPPTCHWKVIWPTVGVYDDPNRSQPPLKSKHNGDLVGSICNSHYNASENETYVPVHTEAATDTVGWMRMPALKQL